MNYRKSNVSKPREIPSDNIKKFKIIKIEATRTVKLLGVITEAILL